MIEHVHDTSASGQPGRIRCPECREVVNTPIIGCPECIPVAALAYAVHLVTEHPKFITTIKAAVL